MPKTTVTLSGDVYLRIRNLSAATGRPMGRLIDELLRRALLDDDAGAPFASVGMGDADVTDLGINAEKYLAEGMGERNP